MDSYFGNAGGSCRVGGFFFGGDCGKLVALLIQVPAFHYSRWSSI